MASGESVHIIGAETLCAAGNSLQQCMETMLEGSNAPAAPTLFNCEQNVEYPVFEIPNDSLPMLHADRTRTAALLLKTVHNALNAAGVQTASLNRFRIGVCIGTSVGASLNFLDFYRDWKGGNEPDLAPIHRYLNSNPAEVVADEFDCSGPCQTVVNACTSGADAIGIGASWIRYGLCDLVIAGGADELSEISYNGFARLMISSPEPCRPFDQERKGLNLGEGAGVLLLASNTAFEKLDLSSRAEIVGYGTCGDAHHLTAPHPEARGLRQALQSALSQAGVKETAIDFINVHGTGTPTNDQIEGAILRELFPDTPFSATKGFTGHTLGAAGAIEAAFTLACLEHGKLPPSQGFSSTDEAIECAPVSKLTEINGVYALSQSLAFGGNNSVLILKRGEA